MFSETVNVDRATDFLRAMDPGWGNELSKELATMPEGSHVYVRVAGKRYRVQAVTVSVMDVTPVTGMELEFIVVTGL